MKKLLAFLVLSLGILNISFAGYTTGEQIEAANNLAEQKIINNHKEDPENYNLDSYVLRQEIAAVARWVAMLDKKQKCDNIFADLSATNPNSWAWVNVEVLVDNNLISANTNFRPEDFITKAETLGMLIKAIWFDYAYDTSSDKGWQEQIVDFAVEKDVIESFTDYDTKATRGWVFTVADTTIKKDEEEKGIKRKVYSDEAM